MSKDEIRRLYEDLGIGDEAERRRYAELARMGRGSAQAPFSPEPKPDARKWLRWDNTCGPTYDEEAERASLRKWLRWDNTCGPSRYEDC